MIEDDRPAELPEDDRPAAEAEDPGAEEASAGAEEASAGRDAPIPGADDLPGDDTSEVSPEDPVEEVEALGAETVLDAVDEEPAPAAEAEPPAPAAEEPPPAVETEAPAPTVEEPAVEELAAEKPPPAEEELAPADNSETPVPEPEPPADRPVTPAADETREEVGDVVPGADLEPDLVLEGEATPRGVGEEFTDVYASAEEPEPAPPAPAPDEDAAPAPVPRAPLDLAADARYIATGKRKTSVARVILKPGDGTYSINGRPLDAFFPRPTLQHTARQPLEAAGYESRMDVVARIHGGGVSSQAGALRHGVARALVEADPNLRTELKKRGYLTRDTRAKERKKAGLKKARKRPQFSKR